MLFNGNFTFFSIFIIFYVIQWESCNFSLFCKFSMLFNGKLVFCQFPMLFNGNLRLEKLRGGGGHTDERTYGRLEIHPCVLQDSGPLGPLPKKRRRRGERVGRGVRGEEDEGWRTFR